ncbi:hypothetical protein GEV33_002100 [Tenebrio molitor]|uniref:Uncharacterized protein n=1 Tax=Tenebrio molitor TaxID=7067 RepID=A0A8J6HVN3_TENMO|nr:hypothetical protein GEV33_002100 [Tenebrio molitor]
MGTGKEAQRGTQEGRYEGEGTSKKDNEDGKSDGLYSNVHPQNINGCRVDPGKKPTCACIIFDPGDEIIYAGERTPPTNKAETEQVSQERSEGVAFIVCLTFCLNVFDAVMQPIRRIYDSFAPRYGSSPRTSRRIGGGARVLTGREARSGGWWWCDSSNPHDCSFNRNRNGGGQVKEWTE